MLNIGYDLRPLQSPHKYRGIGRHCGDLLRSLRRRSKDVAFSFLAYEEPNFSFGDYVRLKTQLKRKSITALLQTAGTVASLDVDLFHYHMQITPLRNRVPTVITVHDTIIAWLGRKGTTSKGRMLFGLQSRAARNADAVITVSRHSKTDITRYMGINPDRISVVYNGVNLSYRPVDDVSDVRAKYRLPERFLLYIGALDYRKNPLGLLRIYGKYAKSTNEPLPLVFAGKREYFRAIESYWNDIGFGLKRAQLLFTGYVDEDDLPRVYSAASVLLFPSLYEGFGLPPLEAMACGTPVIAYDNSSISEIVGEWGRLVENENEDEFAESLSELVDDEGLRREFIEKGLRRAGHFSWDKAADKTIEVYKKVAG
ncbi:MAG: glycosyltransferase family 4 protein [bacterium]|nr:glycosyltransferase family 4 protein [bacterium]